MKLKSFGCSFIWGSDLPDESFTPKSIDNIPSNLTWPAIIAKELNYDYQCLAWPGRGNLSIAGQVLKHCNLAARDDLFVISWTFIDRFDYTNTINDRHWISLSPNSNNQASNFYYKNLQSEFRDKLTSLLYIKACIDTLSQMKIPFLMTYIDDLLFDDQWHATPEILILQKLIRPYFTTFNGTNFLSYAKNLGHKTSSNGHFDEHAHYDAAQCILKTFVIQNKFDC